MVGPYIPKYFSIVKRIASSILFAGLFAVHALADSVALESANGNKIEAEIIAATETTVTIKRSVDGKNFDIELDMLAPESVELVRAWLKKEQRKPSKKLDFNIGDSSGRYDVSLLVPKGEYNTIIHAGNTIRISFETGQLQLWITGKDERLSETLEILTKARESRLGNMTPADREKNEPLMKITPATHGRFDGYLTENSGSFYGRFTTGDFILEVNLTTKSNSPIEWEDLPGIVSTISISDAK